MIQRERERDKNQTQQSPSIISSVPERFVPESQKILVQSVLPTTIEVDLQSISVYVGYFKSTGFCLVCNCIIVELYKYFIANN